MKYKKILDLRSFIKDESLIIDKYHWQELNSSYSKDELKYAISDAIEGLPLPLLPITAEDAKKDFKKMQDFSSRKLLRKSELYTKAEYQYDLSNWYLSNALVGRNSSNYFHQEARWNVKHAKFSSPVASWTEKKLHKEFLGPLWSMKMKEVNDHALRECIVLRKYIASQFPPAVAKELYNLFEAKHVFDFSMGWGDRLSGFHASNAETYYGTDPNVAVYKNYENQNVLYDTKKKTVFKNSPAEDLDLSNEKFDMIFTSPPYFDAEQYSTDETQSYKRYGDDIEHWLKDFLFATIDKCWNSLEDKGTMIINISDIFKNGKALKICDPMNDYISKLPNAHYTGCTGLRLSKRPNSKTSSPEAKNKQSVEPIWIWKKNDKRSLEQIIEDRSPFSQFWSK
jgi:hypothetical protein